MVGDWQHAEGPLMRARMSDAYGRASFLCAFVPPQSFPCVENDRAIGAATADKALAEARTILADAEPRQEQGTSGHWPCGRPNMAWQAERFCYDESGYLSGTGWMAHAALVESLRSFVEGD